jgi:rfaE bifunctional protein nucleotidyltransferase chain/domain
MNIKIKELGVLSDVCDQLKNEGKKVVLCHGCFDLLHIGHLRHFETAKKHGDILVVTLTGDAFVNKGPNRPVFPSELRCEMLAGMDVVDYVAVIEEHSAIPSIKAVRPSIYVKGGEYANHAKDVTGKIALETELVESFGGKVIYTNDLTFSSSNLLNHHFELIDKPVRVFLDRIKAFGGEKQLEQCLEDISKLRVLVVGEAIVDEYQYVSPMGKAAKENIIATQFNGVERFAGGAVAVANHIASMCQEVEIMTLLGDGVEEGGLQQENYYSFIREALEDTVKLSVVERPNAPTVRKIRFVEPTYVRKLFEVCHINDTPLPAAVRDKFLQDLSEKIKHVDVVIVCDFGHGFLDAQAVDLLQREAPFLAVNVQSNSANIGYNLMTKYRRADIVCVDAMEARLAARNKHANLSEIAAKILPNLIESKSIIVTHGKNGCLTFDADTGDSIHIPAFKHAVVDTIGAGDAFFVMAALFSKAGANNELAAFVGNVAGSIKIGVVGHRQPLTKLQLQRSISTILK